MQNPPVAYTNTVKTSAISTSEKISDIQNASAVAFMSFSIAKPVPANEIHKIQINQQDSKPGHWGLMRNFTHSCDVAQCV
jgi:hypothetical protein